MRKLVQTWNAVFVMIVVVMNKIQRVSDMVTNKIFNKTKLSGPIREWLKKISNINQ